MAGDWIKMRVGLVAHPRTMRIAECLLESADYLEWSCLSYGVQGYPPPSESSLRRERHAALRVTRYVTVAALLRFWGYANEHAKGDHIAALWPEDLDEITGVPGFSEAIEAAGWAEFDAKNGGLTMPNFEEHNTSATERTSSAAERQKRYRERQKAAREGQDSDVTRDVTVTPREEKRREEKKEDTPQPPQAGEGGGDVQSPSKAGLICRAIKGKGVPGVSPSNPELLALIEKGVPVETFEAAAEVCAKSTPPKGLGYLLAIVKRQITEAAAIADGPAAQSADPDSRSAIEAEGVAKGIGKWNEIAEQWHVYKARVRGKPMNNLGLDALAAMAAQRSQAGAH